jgi:hypothetical protein
MHNVHKYGLFDHNLERVTAALSPIIYLIEDFMIVNICRRMKNESEIYSNWWRISWEDIIFISFGKSKASSIGLSVSKVVCSVNIVFSAYVIYCPKGQRRFLLPYRPYTLQPTFMVSN